MKNKTKQTSKQKQKSEIQKKTNKQKNKYIFTPVKRSIFTLNIFLTSREQ